MLDNAIPDAAVLRQLLRYEPETGKLFWLYRNPENFYGKKEAKVFNSQFSGKQALSTVSGGYRQGRIFNMNHWAHRVAWMIHNGDIPDGMIVDHINGIKSDNRISNLRLANKSQNAANSGMRSSNTSGQKGVYMNKQVGKWVAEIKVDGRRKRIGTFSDIDEAAMAYQMAAEHHFGDFAVKR